MGTVLTQTNCTIIPRDGLALAVEGGSLYLKLGATYVYPGYSFFLSDEAAREFAEAILANLPKPEAPAKPQGFSALSPLAQKMVQHMRRAGSISAREAMNDYGVSSGSMVRRICDIEEAGFKVKRDKRKHPMTGRQYTRYSLVEV